MTVVLLSQHREQGTEHSFYFDSEIHQGLALSRSSPPHTVFPIYLDDKPFIPYALNIIMGKYINKEGGLSSIAQQIKERQNQIKLSEEFHPEGARIFQGMVIYAELLNFSGMALNKKSANAKILSKEISNYPDFTGPDWLEFRGGAFILFKQWDLEFDSRIDLCSKGLAWGLSLHHTLKEQGEDLAIVVDWEDCGRRMNIPSVTGFSDHMFGNAFIRAPSLVGFSNQPHVLISEYVYSMMKEWFKMDFTTQLHDLFCESHLLKKICKEDKVKINNLTFHDLDKSKYSAYNFYVLRNGENELIYGNRSRPHQKVWIEYRVKPGEENPFVKKLAKADEAIVLGVTNENLAALLNQALEKRGGIFWDFLQVIFPSKSIIGKIVDQHNKDESSISKAIQIRTKLWNEGRQLVHRFLSDHGNSENSMCLIFDGNLAFIGQRFHFQDTNAEIGSYSSIRTAPVLPGIDFKESYYTEVFEGTKMYTILNNSINEIISKSFPMIEWILYGRYGTNEKNFMLQGLKNRRNIDESELYIPKNERPILMVVLVILHFEHYAVLQKREKNNASDNHDLYSNISGYVSDLDLLTALKTTRSSDYQQKTIGEDEATTVFNSVLEKENIGLKVGKAISEDKLLCITKYTALRELKEELGVEFDENNLKPVLKPPFLDLDLGHKILFFKLFTLQISEDTLDAISEKRPDSNLEKIDLSKLKRFKTQNKLNKLLSYHFDKFMSLYDKIFSNNL